MGAVSIEREREQIRERKEEETERDGERAKSVGLIICMEDEMLGAKLFISLHL